MTATHTILAVEDAADIVALYRDLFADEGWVLVASAGPDAVRLARSLRPAAIILDLLLADEENGWDIRTRLLLDRTTRAIPVILVTAVPPARQQLRAMRVDAVLTKPFHLSQLTDAVRAALADPPRFIEREGEDAWQ